MPKIAKTQPEAAKQLGVTTRQFQNWLKEPWFPKGARSSKGYDVGAIKAARDSEGRKGSDESDTHKNLRTARSAEQLKRDRLRTRREEIELAEREGRLIPRQAVEVFASALLTEFGDWCDTLPGFVARLVPASAKKRVRAKLTAELDQRRQLLSDTLQAKARELDHAQSTGGEASA